MLALPGRQLLSDLEPAPGPSQPIVRTTESTDSIAESMTKEFRYNPSDKTPPKRRMRAVAGAVKSAVTGDADITASPDKVLVADYSFRTGHEDHCEDDSEDGYGPAGWFLKSDMQRQIEENWRLTILSEHTEPSSSQEDDARSLADSSSKFRMEQQNLSALNIVEPGAWMGQNFSRKAAYCPSQEQQDPFEDWGCIGAAESSRVDETSVFPAEQPDNRLRVEGGSPAELDGSPVADVASSSQHPSAMMENPGAQLHSVQAAPVSALTREQSSSPVHLSPIREVDSPSDLLPALPDTSAPVPLQAENEKAPPVSTHGKTESSELSSSEGRAGRFCSIVLYVLAWALPLTFLATAMYSMATARSSKALNEVPQGLFSAESRTVHSENGSGKLTMVWVDGHTVGFDVSAIVSTTLEPNIAGSNSWRFLFDWGADGAELSANAGAAGRLASVMPLPSFGDGFLRNMGFLGLYAAIAWLVNLLFSSVSRCWHTREDGNVFWTRALLRRFDGRRRSGSLSLAAVVSAAVWSAVSTSLLSMST